MYRLNTNMARLILMMFLATLFINVSTVLANSILIEENIPSASPWTHNAQASVRLLSAVSGVGNETKICIGLHIVLRPHWKIYWHSPGDSGSPTRVDWSESQNIREAITSWPVPKRFSLSGIETIGYDGEVVLPVTIVLKQPKTCVLVKVKLEYLVCSDVCIPRLDELSLLIPVGPVTQTLFTHIIKYYNTYVPGNEELSGIHVEEATTEIKGQEGIITIKVRTNRPLTSPDLFIETGIHTSAPKIQNNTRNTVMQVRTARPIPPGTLVTMTLVDSGNRRALESTLLLTEAKPSDITIATRFFILGIALLGGLILNLMPCVLPVLSLKIIALIHYNNSSDTQIRRSLIASASGILCTFILLAIVTITLQAIGMTVRWGMQFQQPLFLVVFIVIMILLAAGVWEKVNISFPSWFVNRICWRQSNAFINGFVSTMLATPCSAPFLGTAVGFALTHGPLEIILIFFTLGLGMALPYFIAAFIPGFSAYLPKPGYWMVVLKHTVGTCLLATVIWLHVVLAEQVGVSTSITIGLITLVMMVSLILRDQIRYFNTSLIVLIASGLMVALVLIGDFPSSQVYQPPTDTNTTHGWIPFNEDAIARYTAMRHVVFVDVTAKWCITCQLNKIAVLSRNRVVERLRGAIKMQADWTQGDQHITAYLAKFGRYGVPFNAVYGPHTPSGLLLPEILTVEDVLIALNTASD